MRWFKHMTNARNDEELAEILDDHGPEGVGVYWMILEVIAEKMDGTDRCHAQFSDKNWAKKAGVSTRKFNRMVRVLAGIDPSSGKNLSKFGPNSDRTPLIKLTINDGKLRLECPNLLKFRDEHTRRLRSKSVATQEQEIELDTEVEVETEGDPPLPPKGGSAPAQESPKLKAPKTAKIDFDFDERKFAGIEQVDIDGWAEAYPALDVVHELRSMREWLLANPEKRKVRYRRFITNWLKRSQDKGGNRASKSKGGGFDRAQIEAELEADRESNNER